jgi:hypothetical protein
LSIMRERGNKAMNYAKIVKRIILSKLFRKFIKIVCLPTLRELAKQTETKFDDKTIKFIEEVL